MRPIELTIAGLNSFEEEQRVNFSELISQGLFGIFGPTGSGKSSILDALILALYDKIPRYESGSNRNFINLNSDVMTVSFKFSLDKDTDRYYCVERSYKKWKDTYKPVLVRLYYFNGVTEILAEKANEINKKIVELIGLNYDDFVRAIIIPQGKFSEFLHLANTERRTMLERIFRLEDYGDRLLRTVRAELAKTRAQYEKTNAALAQYGDISAEGLTLAEKEIKTLEAENTELKAKKEETEKAYALVSDAWEAELERRDYARERAVLLEQSEKIALTKTALKQAEAAEGLRPIIKQREAFREKLGVWEKELEDVKKDFTRAVSENELAKETYDKAVELRENTLPGLLKKEEKLTQALKLEEELKSVKNEHAALQSSYKKKREQSAALETKNKELAESILTVESDAEKLRKKKTELFVSLEEMREVESLAAIEEKLNEREKEINSLKIKIDEQCKNEKEAEKTFALAKESLESAERDIKQIQNEILAGLYYYRKHLALKLSQEKASEEESRAEFLNKTKQAEELAAAIELLERKNLAAVLARTLAENEPCPVCGSTDHPMIAKAAAEEFLNEQRSELSQLQKSIETLNNTLQEKRQNIVLTERDMQNADTRIESLVAEFACSEEDENRFNGRDFSFEQPKFLKENGLLLSVQSFETEQTNKRNALIALREKSRKAALSKATVTETLEALKTRREEQEARLDVFKKEKSELNAQIAQTAITRPEGGFLSVLKLLRQKEEKRRRAEREEEKLSDRLRTLNKEKESGQAELQTLREVLAQIETSGKEKAIQLSAAKDRMTNLCESGKPLPELEICKSRITEINTAESAAKKKAEASEISVNTIALKKRDLEKSLADTSSLEKENRNEIESFMRRTNISSEKELAAYLSTDKEHLRAKIKDYDTKLSAAENNLKRLEEKLLPYAEVEIENELRLRKQSAESFAAKSEENGQTLAVKRKSFEDMKKNLKTALELKTERDKTKKNMDGLKELSDLFAGKAFVEFVAKKQLAYITAETSKRLRMISGGRYSLELLEADFVIKDNLNGGLLRSPRTLSGGETFVVSLCLALALSSRIQMKNSAALDLFFLDEGFGSLDPLTLETVLDSLEKLRKENLTVGLITHVEELKNRIENRLTVIPAEQGVHGTMVV